MSIEGVLASEVSTSISTASPIRSGIALYHALKTGFRIALSSSNEDRDLVQHWLTVHSLSDHPVLLTRTPRDSDCSNAEVRERHLYALRGLSEDVGLLVTPSPAVAARSLFHGIPTMLFSHPTYMRPEFRPDAAPAVREWSQIEAEVDRQVVLIRTDPRKDASTL